MGFDLFFVKLRTDEDREAAAVGEADKPATVTEFSAEELDRWSRIVPAVKAIVPEFSETVTKSERLLFDGRAIELSIMPRSSVYLRVPYWFFGDAADDVIELLRQIAMAIENTTDLVAFDPQCGGLFLDGGIDKAADAFEWGSKVLRDYADE